MAKALKLRQATTPLLVIDACRMRCSPARASPLAAPLTKPSIAGGDPAFTWSLPADEWDAIALNYTSGTTGNPKGVVYHHRGAATNAISNILEWDLPKHTRSTSGRCRCSIATAGAFPGPSPRGRVVNVCLRRVEAQAIFDAMREPRRDPLLRRAHRARPAGEFAGGDEGRCASRYQGHGGGRRAAGLDDRRHGADGLRPDPRLRPDRGLRTGHGLCEARELGCAGHRRTRPAERAPGVCATTCSATCAYSTRRPCSRCRWTARPWARSCSRATSP